MVEIGPYCVCKKINLNDSEGKSEQNTKELKLLHLLRLGIGTVQW